MQAFNKLLWQLKMIKKLLSKNSEKSTPIS